MQTVLKIKLNNNKEVELTLNFAKLLKLSQAKKNVYRRYNDIVNSQKGQDVLDLSYVIYTAYICASEDYEMTFEKFLELLPPDQALVNELYAKLIAPSKSQEFFKSVRSSNIKRKK